MNASRLAGGRAPAPGLLAMVQAFINTRFDLGPDWGADVLADPPALADWLAARGLLRTPTAVSGAEFARVLSVRDGLFALVLANNGEPLDPGALAGLNAAGRHAPVLVQLSASGPALPPARAQVDGAVAMLLATTAAAMLDGSWARLKGCPGHHCGWAFYDRSRNHGGRWCAMTVCGARTKARRYYRRRAGSAS